MKKTYKHLFFDLDHTLWDFEKNSELTLEKLYAEYSLSGRGVDDFHAFVQIFNAHNDRLWERFRNGYIRRDDLRWKRFWLALLDFKIGDTALAHELSSAYLEIMPTQSVLTPHAREILDYCSTDGKYCLHLITNGFETTQWMKLHYSGISSYFKEIITSEKSNALKPHADIFQYALKATGAMVEDSIMIGDALEVDVMGALNAGWDQVYYNPAKKVHARKPTYEIHHLADLRDIF